MDSQSTWSAVAAVAAIVPTLAVLFSFTSKALRRAGTPAHTLEERDRLLSVADQLARAGDQDWALEYRVRADYVLADKLARYEAYRANPRMNALLSGTIVCYLLYLALAIASAIISDPHWKGAAALCALVAFVVTLAGGLTLLVTWKGFRAEVAARQRARTLGQLRQP